MRGHRAFPDREPLCGGEKEGAEIGVLLSFSEPTAGMRAVAAEAGFGNRLRADFASETLVGEVRFERTTCRV